MAGDYIIMRVDLEDDPDVILISSLAGIEIDLTIGKLQRLWSWADKHTRDGFLRGVTAQFVNEKARCDGFAEAMETAGWMLISDDGITFLNFERHNGSNAKSRADSRKRKQKSRENDVTKMSRSGHKNVTKMSQKTVTREEKRREEKRNSNTPPNPPRGEPVKLVSVEIPVSLDTPEFRKAFDDWREFKREKGQAYKPTGLKTLLKQLSEWGPVKSVQSIEHSMACNYAGLFEPRAGPGSGGGDLFGGLREFVQEEGGG